MNNQYADNERISYEGIAKSLKSILDKVGETSELQREIEKVNDLANDLVQVWTSEESRKAKSSIEEVNNQLITARLELNKLIEELNKYNEAANVINTGTMA